MRGRDVHDRSSFVILCNASMKKNGQSATTHTSLYTYTDISGGIAKINLQTRLKLTVFMLIQSSNVISTPSCFFEYRDVYIRHSLNARKVINWKLNFRENN